MVFVAVQETSPFEQMEEAVLVAGYGAILCGLLTYYARRKLRSWC